MAAAAEAAVLRSALAAPGVREREVSSSNGGIDALIQRLATTQQEAFYVMDVRNVVGLWEKWARCLPAFRPFYAVKCNPEPALLAVLAALGAGFDCASRAEIEAVLSLGISPEKIVFANPCKAAAHIKYSALAGVELTTFDSVEEVDKLRRLHPRTSALLRVKPPDDGGARCPLGSKYGALPDEVVPLLRAASAAGIAVVGVSFHIGSGATHAGAYSSAIAAARGVFDAAAELGLPRMRVLNIGGGFTPGQQFEAAAAAITASLRAHFDEPGLVTMAEPGRFFAETAFTLATTVIGKRVRGERREYWVNDGIYGSMNCLLYDRATVAALPLACSSNPGNAACKGLKLFESTVFGPTCDALDTVLSGQQLPELQVNDWLVFPNMGAYTAAAGSNFNGFATSAIKTYVTCSPPPVLE